MASFEESLARLEVVIQQLEAGNLTLEQSVSLYEEGVRLSDACRAELDRADGRIQVLHRGRSGRMDRADFVPEEPEEEETEEALADEEDLDEDEDADFGELPPDEEDDQHH